MPKSKGENLLQGEWGSNEVSNQQAFDGEETQLSLRNKEHGGAPSGLCPSLFAVCMSADFMCVTVDVFYPHCVKTQPLTLLGITPFSLNHISETYFIQNHIS